jgi:hypothetical protein
MQGADGSEDGRIAQVNRGPGHVSIDRSPVRLPLSERLRTCNVLELLGFHVYCPSL